VLFSIFLFLFWSTSVNTWSVNVGLQVRQLEGELDAEQRHHVEAQKAVRRLERRVQELTQISEDEEKARDIERETMEKLQSKLKQYKRDLDDAVSAFAVLSSKLNRLMLFSALMLLKLGNRKSRLSGL